jgi:anti-sigma factor RsiW
VATCAAIDPLVTPYVDGELAAADRVLVDEHLRRCPPCQARCLAEQAVRSLVRARKPGLSAERASDALRARCEALAQVTATIGGAAPGSAAGQARLSRGGLAGWGTRLAPIALAASLVLIVGGAFLYQSTSGSARALAAEQAADHVKCFALDDLLGTHDTPAAVESAMLSGFGWHLTVAGQFDRAGLDLVGARRCLYTHGLVAHLMYRHEGEAVSIFMLPKTERSEALVEVLGHQAAIWSAGDRTFVLVARGSRAEVQRMAAYARTALH